MPATAMPALRVLARRRAGRREIAGSAARLQLGSARAGRCGCGARSCAPRPPAGRRGRRRCVGAHDELGGPPADVDHDGRLRRGLTSWRVAHRAEERQLGLLLAGEHLCVQGELARTRSVNSAPLEASRTADVSTARFRLASRTRSIVGAIAGERGGHPPEASSDSAPAESTRRRAASPPSGGAVSETSPAGRRPRRAGGSSWCLCRRPPRALAGIVDWGQTSGRAGAVAGPARDADLIRSRGRGRPCLLEHKERRGVEQSGSSSGS